MEERLICSFKLYDQDKNGTINRQEMFNLLEASAYLKSKTVQREEIQKKVDYIFKNCDKNGDNLISRHEFIEGCKNDADIYNWVMNI